MKASRQAGLVEFSLRASSSRIKLLGQDILEADLMTYNDSFPGPTMRVKEGDRVDICAKLGTVELWKLVNNTDMDHPFHLHVNAFQVYARNGKPEPQPVWKDVVNVRSQETVQILVPFADFTGKTMFHCHLLEHEELGMMGVVEMVA